MGDEEWGSYIVFSLVFFSLRSYDGSLKFIYFREDLHASRLSIQRTEFKTFFTDNYNFISNNLIF